MPSKKLKPRKQAVQKRSRHTVDCILEGAAHIFSQKGYALTTTNHIAEKAGVSIGSLYQYFPNKEAIIVSLAQQHLTEVGHMIDGLLTRAEKGELAVSDMLGQVVNNMIDIHMQAPRLHQAIFNEAPLPEDLKQALSSYERKLAVRLENILSSTGALPLEPTATSCLLMVQVIESLSHWYAVNVPENITRDKMAEEMIAIIEAYMNREK